MKRAQIKMFETIAVLVVFMFLLITGSIFFFQAQKSGLAKEKVKATEQYAFQIVLKTLYLAELDCSFLVTQRDNCIDKIKLDNFAELLKDENAQTDYFVEFGYATITVKEVYPQKTSKQLYHNALEEDGVPLYTSRITTQNPILLYDAWRDEYSFGVLEVDVYVE